MKKIVFILAFVLMAVPALAVDTTLDTPHSIANPAVTLRQVSFEWLPDRFITQFQFLDAQGNIVGSKKCELVDHVEVVTPASCSDGNTYKHQGQCERAGGTWTAEVTQQVNDFSQGANAVVNAGAVGKKYGAVLKGYIQNKCKGKWNLAGTDSE